MSYALSIKKGDGYLQVTASGTRSFETVLALIEDILAAGRKENTGKALVDLRALKGHIDMLDAFTIPEHHFPKLRYLNVITRCAVVDLEEYEERARFFEDVAVNRGFFIRYFTDPHEAIEWLKS